MKPMHSRILRSRSDFGRMKRKKNLLKMTKTSKIMINRHNRALIILNLTTNPNKLHLIISNLKNQAKMRVNPKKWSKPRTKKRNIRRKKFIIKSINKSIIRQLRVSRIIHHLMKMRKCRLKKRMGNHN